MSTDDRVSQIEAELKALSQKRKALISELRSIAIGVDVGIERSRSGNGGHAWIFFEEEISALKQDN